MKEAALFLFVTSYLVVTSVSWQHDLTDETGNSFAVEVGEREVVSGILKHPHTRVFVWSLLEAPLCTVAIDVHSCNT